MKRFMGCAAATLFVWGILALSSPLSAAAAEPAVSVESIVFAREVASREPVGEASEFGAAVTRVTCWTKLSTKAPPARVKHVWYKDGREQLAIPLTVNHSSGRYWSVKNVSPGEWKVEVVGESGEVFGSGRFTVK